MWRTNSETERTNSETGDTAGLYRLIPLLLYYVTESTRTVFPEDSTPAGGGLLTGRVGLFPRVGGVLWAGYSSSRVGGGTLGRVVFPIRGRQEYTGQSYPRSLRAREEVSEGDVIPLLLTPREESRNRGKNTVLLLTTVQETGFMSGLQLS